MITTNDLFKFDQIPLINKQEAINFITNFNLEDESKPTKTQNKRSNFKNSIRLQKNQRIRKTVRKKLEQTFKTQKFLDFINSLAEKKQHNFEEVSNLLKDLRSNCKDLSFCLQIKNQETAQKFLISLYEFSRPEMSLDDKRSLIQSLLYLTYYGMSIDSGDQLQSLCESIINEITIIDECNPDQINYMVYLMDLITNVTSQKDKDINFYLMDSHLLPTITCKITKVAHQVHKIDQSTEQQLFQTYYDLIFDLRSSFSQALINLSSPEYQHVKFYEFVVNEFVQDCNYAKHNTISLLKILNNFFCHSQFSFDFINNSFLVQWFEKTVIEQCQHKFDRKNQNSAGQFQDIDLSAEEREVYFQILYCFNQWAQLDSVFEEASLFIQMSINMFYLSEFTIQCSLKNDDDQTVRRNSRYVAEAIKLYQFLAANPNYKPEELLLTTKSRNYEDLLKVFLHETFFTSYKISDVTLSLLNKLISKNHNLLKTFFQLGIQNSIFKFMEQDLTFLNPDQIVNFIELLTLMIAADNDLSKNEKRQFSKTLERFRSLRVIEYVESLQDNESKIVAEKAGPFLEFIEASNQGPLDSQIIDI